MTVTPRRGPAHEELPRVSGQNNPASPPSPAQQRAIRGPIERTLPGSSPETLRVLGETAHIVKVRTSERIFRQGEPVPLTLVLSGHGAFRRTTIDGQQITVGIAPPGYLLGYTSISSGLSSVDLVALTATEVAHWAGSEIRHLAATDVGFALEVIGQMGSFLSSITEKVDGFLHQNARRRVVRILARHEDLFFGEPAVLSRAHLPSLVGTSREMTGRVLRELEREGTVARVGRTGLRLLRPDTLQADAAPLTQEER
jgi:CRP-like cAMP-binding protein